MGEMRERNDRILALCDAKLEQRLADLKAELIKWRFPLWLGTVARMLGFGRMRLGGEWVCGAVAGCRQNLPAVLPCFHAPPNPILRRSVSACESARISRIAWKTTRNCRSYFCSNSASFRASAAW